MDYLVDTDTRVETRRHTSHWLSQDGEVVMDEPISIFLQIAPSSGVSEQVERFVNCPLISVKSCMLRPLEYLILMVSS